MRRERVGKIVRERGERRDIKKGLKEKGLEGKGLKREEVQGEG